MKQSKLSMFFPTVFLLLGGGACLCTKWLFASSLDALGLVIPSSFPEILLWVLVAAACIGAFAAARFCAPTGENNALAAIGELIYAVGIITLISAQAKGPALMITLFRVFTYLSIAALAVSAVLRIAGRKPHFLLTVPVCIHSVLFLVECYQLWSEVPQLLEYVLGVGAVLGLTLFSYHRMARSAALPFKPRHLAYGFIGIFFCLAAVSMGTYALYFAAAALWMTADLTAACAVAAPEA